MLRHESPLGTFVPFVVSPFEVRTSEARGHATPLHKPHRHSRSPILRGNLTQEYFKTSWKASASYQWNQLSQICADNVFSFPNEVAIAAGETRAIYNLGDV